MNAELTFLQFLQSLHSPMLDGSMCFITRLGDSGILWVTLTALLLVFRKTRRVGCVLAAALLIDAVLCNLLLKPLVARVRPCDILTEVQLPFGDVTCIVRHNCLSRTRTISPFLRAIRRRPSPR